MAFGDSDPVVSFVLYSCWCLCNKKKDISIELFCVFFLGSGVRSFLLCQSLITMHCIEKKNWDE
jgi:hypothetical protein